MNIAENIISQKLKGIYFIIGGSCAGKTTASKYISEKYDMYRYSTDEMRKTYYERAIIEHQPTLCRKIKDFYELSVDEALLYEADVAKEATPMIIADLIELSGKYERIVCEGVYAVPLIPLIDYNKIIYLSTSDEIIKRDFFNRDAQSSILMSILNNPDITESEKENRINHRKEIACGVISKLDEFINDNIKRYYRNDDSTIEDMLNIIEQHFELTSMRT